MNIALSVLPLALLVAAGYALAKSGTIPRGSWGPIETLTFRALIPAVLILAIAESDLSVARFGGFVTVLLLSLAVLSAMGLATRLMLPDRQMTSIFQLGVRWNAFVALAAAEQFAGLEALAGIAVAIAVLIPLINVLCILVLAGFGPQATSARQIGAVVARNPLVQACAVGLILNLSGVSLPASLRDALGFVAGGAVGVGLLSVGAGISLRRLARLRAALVLPVLLRPLLAPVVFVGFAMIIGLNPVQTLAGVLVFAAPAATNGYIVAKQMGGDAELYADALTWQTVVCLLVLPIWGWILI